MKHILITHEKGGCGVTTTATNVAYLLAQKGLRVLLVDLESRGDCATAFGLDPAPVLAVWLADCAVGRDVDGDLVRFARAGIDVMPTNSSGLRSALSLIDGYDDGVVRGWLRDLGDGYDVVLYDAKAASGALRRIVLGLADLLVIPTRLEAFGLAEIVPVVEQYTQAGGDPAHVVILPVAVRKLQVHAYNYGLLKEAFGDRVWVSVPDRVAVPESQSLQSPVCEYAPDNDASLAYRGVAAGVYGLLFREAEGTVEGVGDGQTIR